MVYPQDTFEKIYKLYYPKMFAFAKNYISDLMVLTTKEKEYIDRFEEKKYMPELLFEDAEIVERVKNHPMALWKCKE